MGMFDAYIGTPTDYYPSIDLSAGSVPTVDPSLSVGAGANLSPFTVGSQTSSGVWDPTSVWNTSSMQPFGDATPTYTQSAPGGYSGGDIGGSGGFIDNMMAKWNQLPLDKQFGMGMTALGGLGNMMAAIQSNKLAKKNQKYNDAYMQYLQGQWARQNANQAIYDKLNNSIDTTPAATVTANHPNVDLTHYGETGNATPFYTVTPGQKTTQYLARGGLTAVQQMPQQPQFMSPSLVQGQGDGQSDTVPAMLSPGEYVMDADTVSALGNGDTNAGASALDKMRHNVRKAKRAAKPNAIPKAAKSAEAYIPKKARG